MAARSRKMPGQTRPVLINKLFGQSVARKSTEGTLQDRPADSCITLKSDTYFPIQTRNRSLAFTDAHNTLFQWQTDRLNALDVQKFEWIIKSPNTPRMLQTKEKMNEIEGPQMRSKTGKWRCLAVRQ